MVLAAVVLLVWGVWLLVPESTRLDLLGGEAAGSPASSSQAGAGQDGAVVAEEDRTAAGAREPATDRGADQASAGRAVADPAGDAPAADPAQGSAQDPGQDAADDGAADDGAAEDGAADDGAADDGAADPPQDPAPDPAAPGAEPVEVPQAGDGSFAVAPGSGTAVGSGDLVRYTVEVEGGVPLDPAQVASVVERVLADPRSWTAQGRWSLQRVSTDPDARIVVASPDTTDRLCAPLRTRGQVSCRNGDVVVLNADRWTRGARSWGDDVAGYQEYVVNHELGHYLGNGHVPCPGAGRPAPVMLQQTIGLDGCAPNAWPYP